MPVSVARGSNWSIAWVGTNNPYHGKVKSIDQDFTSTTVTEKVVMTEISYDQKTFLSKSLPWTSQADEDFDMEIYNPINHLKYCKNSNDNDRNACDDDYHYENLNDDYIKPA